MTVETFGEQSKAIKPGTLAVWTGDIVDIPQGWGMADGNNGTPNLTDRFVKSVGSVSSDPGNRGGQSSWTPDGTTMPPHTHTIGTDTAGDHTHSFNHRGSGANSDKYSVDIPSSDSSGNTIGASGHTHDVDTDNTGTTSPSSIDNEPEFYETIYIQKL